MPDSKDYVAYETDESRTVRFLLPENKVLETELYLVVFDRITVPATTDKTVVTGADFRAKTMPLDDAYVVMADSLEAFGLDTSAVDQWRADIEGRPKSGPSADQRIEGGGNTVLGYLGIGVGGLQPHQRRQHRGHQVPHQLQRLSSRMLWRMISMVLVGLLATGCTVSFDGDTDARGDKTPHATAPTDDDGVEVWDLRTRPTAQDVGMPDSKDYVAYETDESRTVRFLLPEGKVLETELYLVVFDRVTVPATTDKTVVTGMDFHAKSMPLDDAYVVMGDSLEAFGLDTSPVDEWRAEIETRPKDGPSANLRIEGGGNTEIGYLDIGVGGVYNPINGDGTASISYRVNFND